ncbi:SRPBCC family protein [Amycolatopsis arida]|nr:SRPBCC family protein [Amycolatopsis arida]
MGDYRYSAPVELPADQVFAFVAEPRNLPKYFPRVTTAEPKDTAEPEGGDAVHVEAELAHRHVEEEAWLRRDPERRALSWGAEDDEYHGELRVEERGPDAAEVHVALHTGHADGERVQRELERTVAAITHLAAAETDVAAADDQRGWL